MIPESLDTIMHRNNTTTLPAAQNNYTAVGAGERDAPAGAADFGKTHGKHTAMIAAFSVVLCFCLLSSAGAASVHKRAIASVVESTMPPTKLCNQNTPCGWAIYVPFTRRIDYFMKNTCDCSSNLACLKTEDDLSVNAYVYRCKTRPPSTTTDEMPTSESEEE